MASPQMKDGFVGVANDLFERIYQSGISQRELVAMFCLIRYSYGYRQKYAVFGNAILASNTGMDYSNAKKTIEKLKSRNMVRCLQESAGPRPGIYTVNKDWETWELGPGFTWPPLTTRVKSTQVASSPTWVKSTQVKKPTGVKSTQVTGVESTQVTWVESTQVAPPKRPSPASSQGGPIHETHDRHDPSLRSGGAGGVWERCASELRKLDTGELNFRNRKKLREFLKLDLPGPIQARLLTEAVDRTQQEGRWDWPVSVALNYAGVAAAQRLSQPSKKHAEDTLEDRNVVYKDE